ncbi:hypothetical protein [Pseudomonas mucidolens]|uniref:Uncharacterized protein n=1 Tax=Pseudomonas mucidolens TaxID=46679 RepID=A0A1H2P1V5_9PSED|nr:hypothetical protein [Pseudomonas mucidolens]SDV11673.1 hypothetical protein SAMN05216202_5323 [Pseudomonas mucidolens]SQH36542.1 Uncharacterised protein [Pseudomonas mucidolens]
MRVLTIYFCGTSSNQFDAFKETYWNGELISTLARNTQGREFADWIIIDGPGSGNLQEDELFTKPGGYYKLSGIARGSGWEENVKHAAQIIKGKFDWQREKLTAENYKQLQAAGVPIEDVNATGCWLWRHYEYGDRQVTPQLLQEQIIKMFRKEETLPEQVNLVGWSRGGVSCVMLANLMLNDPELKGIHVNIFAVDPVPGATNFDSHRVQLGENVREYVAMYARDERSTGFMCVIPNTDVSTKVSIYPMAGRHATLVGNAAANGAKGTKVLFEPGDIVRHYAEVCLTRWGVSLDKMLSLTAPQLDQRLATIKKSYNVYTVMRSTTYTARVYSEIDGERKVHFNGDAKFSSVSGPRFSPEKGLSVGHIPDSSYFNDIV